jgi:hypothetical protein
VRQYIKECPICQKNKSENILSLGLLQPMPIFNALFVEISMDFMEGLPKSNGKEVIFLVVDNF